MSAISPATIQNRVISEINHRLQSGLPLGEGEKFWLNGLRTDALKLRKVDPVAGYIALAGLAQLQWDEATSREMINCALQLRRDPYTLSQLFVVLSNFGYFSEALPLIDLALAPAGGHFIDHYKAMYTVGAFQKLLSFQERAAEMTLDLGGLPTAIVEKAANILKDAGISDEQAASALDIAGAMLRERKIMTAGDVELAIDDEFGHLPVVFLTFPLNVKADDAAEMTFDLYEKILDVAPHHSPSFNIGFSAVGAP